MRRLLPRGQGISSVLSCFRIDHARTFVASKLIPALLELLLFATNPHEAGLHPAVLADDRGVPPPPLLRLAQPDKGYIPIRHPRALVQARICPFTLQTPYKGLLWKSNYIIYMYLQ